MPRDAPAVSLPCGQAAAEPLLRATETCALGCTRWSMKTSGRALGTAPFGGPIWEVQFGKVVNSDVNLLKKGREKG